MDRNKPSGCGVGLHTESWWFRAVLFEVFRNSRLSLVFPSLSNFPLHNRSN
jgi:hypothetical protein